MESIVNSAFSMSLESFGFDIGSYKDCDAADVDGGADELDGDEIVGGASGERTRVGGPPIHELCGYFYLRRPSHLKFNNRNNRTMCEICSPITIKTPDWLQ